MKSSKPEKRPIQIHLTGDWFFNFSCGFFIVVAAIVMVLDMFLWGVFV